MKNNIQKLSESNYFVVLSPDGFTIHREREYKTTEEVLEAVEEWKKRFEEQGYYACVKERIPYQDIPDYLTVQEWNQNEEIVREFPFSELMPKN